MTTIFPPKLARGDLVRVVAPSRSKALVDEFDNSSIGAARFDRLGLRLSFGEHVSERDDFVSSSVESRIADLHAAFHDAGVAAVLTVIGGFNSNELLPFLDWDLIRSHPKILCGYSDITALQNAILAKTGLVTYSGPHWSSFGMRDHFEPTGEWFVRAVMDNESIAVSSCERWTDDLWFMDQDSRTLRPNSGWWPLRAGETSGRIVGGNLCTLNLLQGTPYMPSLDGALLFLEDDSLSNPVEFARDLTSLLQQPAAAGVRGLLIGRFQHASGVSRDVLAQIIERQPVLHQRPVMANLDFGHTNPMITFPIGGEARVSVGETCELVITRH
jgi:muramoyltetrapeptide carboxypeptidase